MHTLYYFNDPMCSWCWGYRPVSDQLFASLPDSVTRTNILGGLAPDSDKPMAPELRTMLQGAWNNIHTMFGTEFNFDFWSKCQPRRSTYPACRAVLAAENQQSGERMTDAIQRAYYTRAMNPSDITTLETLAQELNLDRERFSIDIASVELNDELMRQVELAQQSPIDGFPSLTLEIRGRQQRVTRDYRDYQVTLDHIDYLIERSADWQ
jgi:putative protein-disulfide isomerase